MPSRCWGSGLSRAVQRKHVMYMVGGWRLLGSSIKYQISELRGMYGYGSVNNRNVYFRFLILYTLLLIHSLWPELTLYDLYNVTTHCEFIRVVRYAIILFVVHINQSLLDPAHNF